MDAFFLFLSFLSFFLFFLSFTQGPSVFTFGFYFISQQAVLIKTIISGNYVCFVPKIKTMGLHFSKYVSDNATATNLGELFALHGAGQRDVPNVKVGACFHDINKRIIMVKSQ